MKDPAKEAEEKAAEEMLTRLLARSAERRRISEAVDIEVAELCKAMQADESDKVKLAARVLDLERQNEKLKRTLAEAFK